jgi:hypothetical protein
MSTPSSTPPDAAERPPFRRIGSPAKGRGTRWALLLVLLAGLSGIWFVLTRPHLLFTNQLAAPVRIVVGDAPVRTLRPGETLQLATSRARALVAQWEVVRPLSADGRPMGSEVRGSVVIRTPSGTMRRSAAARGTDADYFAPLITNASGELLRVTVNAGLAGSMDCGCAVRPGARRVFIGYYPLFQNSTVRARAAGGKTATFRDLGPNVTNRDGTVGLRVDTGDLR